MDKKQRRDDRIAIIGAGGAGTLAIAALREEGFKPVCYEASDRHGGLWNYREESIEGFGSLMPTTTQNNSKEIGAFSNFPPKEEYSNHMHHRQFFEYLTDYYKRNECDKYVRFNTEVISVKKAADYESTGRLSVTVKNRISGDISTDIFDGVMVGTGHFTFPKKDSFPGLEKFQGEVTHTHSLKYIDKYKDKNVLVIGPGCSGLDAAETISNVANQVYLSTRNGTFVMNRVGPSGYPIDYVMLRRYLIHFVDVLPRSLCSWYFETFYLDSKFDHRLYYVKPKYHVLSRDPIFNEAIFPKLLSGVIKQKGAVKYFTENRVLFDGEDTTTEIDAVVLATGYTFKFPFLEDGLLQIEDGRINLYKTMFPTHLPHPSLAFVGFTNPFGAGFPLMEIQCRWITRIFSGKARLPSNADMLKHVIRLHKANERRFAPSQYTSIQVDYWTYLDDIAKEIGCMPNIWKYAFTDIHLFLRLVFGPYLPYQFRLEGPHKWEGAREAIMTCDDRVRWSLAKGKSLGKSWMQYIYECIGALVPRNVFIP